MIRHINSLLNFLLLQDNTFLTRTVIFKVFRGLRLLMSRRESLLQILKHQKLLLSTYKGGLSLLLLIAPMIFQLYTLRQCIFYLIHFLVFSYTCISPYYSASLYCSSTFKVRRLTRKPSLIGSCVYFLVSLMLLCAGLQQRLQSLWDHPAASHSGSPEALLYQ